MPHTEGGCALKEDAAHGKATQEHVLWYDLKLVGAVLEGF